MKYYLLLLCINFLPLLILQFFIWNQVTVCKQIIIIIIY